VKRSSERILTAHTGNLSRPDHLAARYEGYDQHEIEHTPELKRRITEAVREIARSWSRSASSGTPRSDART
jgi:hypothetical protein